MANYEAPLLQTPVSSAYKSTGILIMAGRRAMVYEVEFGQTGGLSSSDCQCQWDLSRFGATNGMTATAVTTNLLDPGDIASTSLFNNNATAELTYTTAGNGLSLKNWAINQRGSYRWRALDDGDQIMIPSTTGFGVGVRTTSLSFAGSAVGNISFVER